MHYHLTLGEVADLLNFNLEEASRGQLVSGVASLAEAEVDQLSFLVSKKYEAQVAASKASYILVPADCELEPQGSQRFFPVEDPSYDLAKVSTLIAKKLFPQPEAGIHPTACVDATATVSDSAYIGPFVCIGAHSVVGDHVQIHAHGYIGQFVKVGAYCKLKPSVSVLDYSELGQAVVLEPQAVIGADGYGYSTVQGRHEKQPQIGNVVLRDFVEVGAGTTIDRARMGSTIIGEGTKIDNLVQIAHNVKVGKHCLIVAQVGIAGSAVLEDYVVVGGQAGIGGHLTVGMGTQVAGKSGVVDTLAPKSKVAGAPTLPIGQQYKLELMRQRLPDLFKRMKVLEKWVEQQKEG